MSLLSPPWRQKKVGLGLQVGSGCAIVKTGNVTARDHWSLTNGHQGTNDPSHQWSQSGSETNCPSHNYPSLPWYHRCHTGGVATNLVAVRQNGCEKRNYLQGFRQGMATKKSKIFFAVIHLGESFKTLSTTLLGSLGPSNKSQPHRVIPPRYLCTKSNSS
jgi:hypothetical protein